VTDRKYWLGFSLVPEIGPRRIAQLLGWFGDLQSAWTATEAQLREAGLEHQPVSNLLRVRSHINLDAQMERIHRVGAAFITQADDHFPALLRSLPDAPPVLYVRGTLTGDDNRALAIVGTRKATSYGRDAASVLSRQLAQQGITIISGLAQGIDAIAHRAALEAGGRTFAVMGCGVDIIYPNEHRDLAQEITRHGALISEFPLGTAPEARNFPRRNRLISGLSLGVLVVEAPIKSGALITAGIAGDHGREIFAVPGNIFSAMSSGTNRLIQDGAKLVMNVDDILNELEIAHQVVETRTKTERIAPANATEAQLLRHLGTEPVHIDDLVRLSGLPIATVSSTLTLLELKGLARTAGHMQYCLPL
jgi:DNA processing protein